MSLLHAVGCLAVCLTQPPGEVPTGFPEGVYAWSGRVRKVEGKTLVAEVDTGPMSKAILLLGTSRETQLRLFDRATQKGNEQTQTRDIDLAELKPGQKVSVIVYTDGKDYRLLSAIVSGPNLGDEAVFAHVTRLGGKFKKLPAPPNLKLGDRWEIDLSRTKVGDRDLIPLGRLTGLASLNLAFTGVTDAGMEFLRAAPDLQDLNLSGTKVTDRSAATLGRFRLLYSVNVARTGYTQQGIDELLLSFPSLEVCRAAAGKQGEFLVRERYRDGKLELKNLMLGDTLFAVQLWNRPGEPGRGRVATTYYHRKGPVGQMLAKFDWFNDRAGATAHHDDVRLAASLVGLGAVGSALPGESLVCAWSEPAVGVVRLNGGTHAAYGRPFQFFDFYDNSPAIAAFVYPPEGQAREFTFIHDANQRGGNVRLIQGDERPTLTRKGPKQFYQALFVEITREALRDVNTSLMTKEGMKSLMESVAQQGVLCYHISHRYNDFKPPLADAAKALGYDWRVAHDLPRPAPGLRDEFHFSSEWFVVARPGVALPEGQQDFVAWSRPPATGRFLWTDGKKPDVKTLEFKRK